MKAGKKGNSLECDAMLPVYTFGSHSSEERFKLQININVLGTQCSISILSQRIAADPVTSIDAR
jgi:hypothetical protein